MGKGKRVRGGYPRGAVEGVELAADFGVGGDDDGLVCCGEEDLWRLLAIWGLQYEIYTLTPIPTAGSSICIFAATSGRPAINGFAVSVSAASSSVSFPFPLLIEGVSSSIGSLGTIVNVPLLVFPSPLASNGDLSDDAPCPLS